MFTSKELDPETNLYYYGARYYDARLSQWISTDPPLSQGRYFPKPQDFDTEHDYMWRSAHDESDKLPGMGGVFNSINLDAYQYAGLNPIKFLDPDGETLSLADSLKLVAKYSQGPNNGISKALQTAFGFSQSKANQAQYSYCVTTSIFLYLAIEEYAGKNDFVDFLKDLSKNGVIEKNTGFIKSWDKLNKYLSKKYGITYNNTPGSKGFDKYKKLQKGKGGVFTVESKSGPHTSVSYVESSGNDKAIDPGWSDNQGKLQRDKPHHPVNQSNFKNVGTFEKSK